MNDHGYSLTKTDNGDVILVGTGYYENNTGHHGLADIYAIRIDSFGNVVWKKYYGGSDTDNGFDIVKGMGDEYVITGQSDSNDGDVTGNEGYYDIWVFKINGSGDIIWQKTFGGDNWEISKGIDKTSDGNFVIVGETNSDNGDLLGSNLHKFYGRIIGTDIWVIKIDTNGNIIWQTCLGGTEYERGAAIHASSSGNLYVTGHSDSYDGDLNWTYGSNDAWVVKLNENGNILWQKQIGGWSDDIPQGIAESASGDVVVTGYTFSPSVFSVENHGYGYGDCFISKLDKNNGNVLWTKLLGGTWHEEGFKISLCPDGELLLMATSNSTDGDVVGGFREVGIMRNSGAWLIKMAENGDITWQKPFGSNNNYNQIGKAIFTNSQEFVFYLYDSFVDEDGIRKNSGTSVVSFSFKNCPNQIALLTTSENLTQNINPVLKSKNTIKLSNTFDSDINVSFSAGKSIFINPGVVIKQGAVFKADIQECQ
ncbi:3-coathanger stack domain-containing protein [Emticicia sp. SJ17W-69]|uniref:3-coathanger stack domain-containing protein n=1 Tax=Emticicia sp. SJ17W-69 TaxID=3421657 RepID=UPI003EBAA787